MEGPFGVPGRTRRGSESDCLLTLLVDSTAERVKFGYSLNEHDAEDVRQEIFLHVLSNWKHWNPDKCHIGAALRVMVGQGCSRAIAKIKGKGDMRIVLATDTANEDGQDFLNWVPLVDGTGDAEWSPDHSEEIDLPTPHSHKKDAKCSTKKTPTDSQQSLLW
jgi:hypothetical protein